MHLNHLLSLGIIIPCGNPTPNQDAIRQNLSPTLPHRTAAPASATTPGDTVVVPRSAFQPCECFCHDLEQLIPNNQVRI